jgi:hypothetical protein
MLTRFVLREMRTSVTAEDWDGGVSSVCVGCTFRALNNTPGVARRLVTFLLRQKSNQKRRTRRAAFCFCFFVAAISAAAAFIEPVAARKLALTFNRYLHHRVAQTGSRRRPPIVSKNSVGAEGYSILSPIYFHLSF